MMFHREQYEDRQYPVNGRNLRGYKGAFERAGYPTQITPTGAPGIYIIMVSLPQSMPQEIDPYSLPARRHYRTDWRRGATVALSLLLVGMVAYFGWTLFAPDVPTIAGVPVETGGMSLDRPAQDAGPLAGLWDALPAIRWPWAVVQEAVEQAQETANAIGAAVNVALWVGGALLVLSLLWFARGFVGAVIAAVGALLGGKGGH